MIKEIKNLFKSSRKEKKIINEWSNILDADLRNGIDARINKIMGLIKEIKYGPELKKDLYKGIINRLKKELKNVD